MTRIKHFLLLAIAAAGAIATGQVEAGRPCNETRPTARSVERGLNLAEQTMNALNRSGHRVVLLARAGQDLSTYGLRYSHLGLAYQQADGNGGSAWRVLHKLNQCGTGDADIYRQGLGEFFLDNPWRYEAAYLAPAPEIQERLLALLADEHRAVRLHHRPYSIVSYAWGQRYQQSNQWAIETLAMAMGPAIQTRAQAQGWLRAYGYEPSALKIGALTRLGGRVGSANVAFDDHPFEKRFSDSIETVTVDSVFEWLQRTGMGSAPVLVR